MSNTQHTGLRGEQWRRFSLPQHILMIANEMNRGRRFLSMGDLVHLRLTYERVLRLIDLTIEVHTRRTLRRELLRLREVVAALYIAERPDASTHIQALRVLLFMNRETANQAKELNLTPIDTARI